ncbi:hypothetical protein L915_08968, partial [Phytophthora nicotianae]
MSGEVKEALVELGKNYEGARGVPVAGVGLELAGIETGTNEKSSPTERAGSERDEEIMGSTERPERGKVGTAEATERHDVAPDWETRTTERPRRVRNAGRGTTERSEAALKPQKKIEEREKTVEETVCSKRSKGALESTSEDAAGTRINQCSTIIGKVSSGRVEPVARNAKDDEESTKGIDSTEQYDRLVTDIELDMLERGDGPGVQNEPEEYDKELEERLIPVDEDKILQ